ncbi:MAG: hypothetical protein JO359_11555 [Candidatus Eremiobacteraeota bacterium]|nr:hypothetical protein [Candidatus Eremiobacteraeota bacterium]
MATFALPGGRTLESAFAVRDGQSIRIEYQRPMGVRPDPDAGQAMQASLCRL